MSNVTKPILLDETGRRMAAALETIAGGGSGSGLTEDIKLALLSLAENVAYVNENGQDVYDALAGALYDTAWSVSNTLSHCTSSNNTQSVTKGSSYSATITAYENYTLTGATVLITMGGVDITSTAYSNGTISIASVTGVLSISVTAVASQTDYVMNGLIHRYDAIENTSEGHDGSTGVWEDLVGDYDLTLTSTSALTWGTDYLQFDGTPDASVKSASGEVENSEDKTIEIVISTLSSSTECIGNVLYNSEMISDAYGKVSLFNDNSVAVEGKANKSYQTGLESISLVHYIAGEYGNDGKTDKVFVNGEQVTQGTQNHNFTGSQGKLILGGSASATEQIGYRFTGKIHAIRIYNRNLTAEEIAQNYAIDVTRFGLE